MELPVSDQLICALIAVGSGLLFGVVYDLFKALRLKAKSLLFSLVADVFVCLFGLALLFLLFMSIGGGQARLYIVLCAGAGAVIYFVGASAAFLGFFIGILNAIVKFLRLLQKPFKLAANKMKILYKNVKMFFQKSCNWFTIMIKGKVESKPKRINKRQDLKKEQVHEAQTRRAGGKSSHSRARHIRGSEPVRAPVANRKRAGKGK